MKKFFLLFMILFSSLSFSAVNINTATAEQLQTLPGIGPSKAKAIINYRNNNNQFKTIEELENIPGFSQGLIYNLKTNATVR